MERNDIATAPAAADFDSLFSEWKKLHGGSKDEFLSLMTSPDAGRDEFIGSRVCRIVYKTGVAVTTVE